MLADKHQRRGKRTVVAQDVPLGHCHCGCGRKTSIARQTLPARGHIKGQPVRFIQGHCGNKGRDPESFASAWKIDKGSGCWHWQRFVRPDGYGAITNRKAGGSWQSAHSFIYEAVYGPLNSLHVDHLCDNRKCVNPAHLEAVTNAENCRRGRNAKLSWNDVRHIRKLIAQGWRQADIARAFDLSQTHVMRIGRREVWV